MSTAVLVSCKVRTLDLGALCPYLDLRALHAHTRPCAPRQRLLETLAKNQLVALINTGSHDAAMFSTPPKPGSAQPPDILRPGFLLLPRA